MEVQYFLGKDRAINVVKEPTPSLINNTSLTSIVSLTMKWTFTTALIGSFIGTNRFVQCNVGMEGLEQRITKTVKLSIYSMNSYCKCFISSCMKFQFFCFRFSDHRAHPINCRQKSPSHSDSVVWKNFESTGENAIHRSLSDPYGENNYRKSENCCQCTYARI